VRRYGDEPLSRDDLGALLYRCYQIQNEADDRGMAVSQRPTPGGGAIHALEIYPAVRRCSGLDSGLYRYCPNRHGFFRYAGLTPSLEALLDDYEVYVDGGVQVLLLITARFPRMFWKYRTIGYATLLKDTGAFFQSLYLAATALGLAPCAVGSGDSRALSLLIEADIHEETTIGEFLIGSRHPD
jgi:SagB-type dehydrogenase family enzyme